MCNWERPKSTRSPGIGFARRSRRSERDSYKAAASISRPKTTPKMTPMMIRRGVRSGCVDGGVVDDISLVGRRGQESPRRTGQHHILSRLHDRRNCDAHDCQSANQFAANYCYRGQQKLLSLLIRLAQDGMAVIKSAEELRQLEGVFGKVGWLCGRDALIHNVGRLCR